MGAIFNLSLPDLYNDDLNYDQVPPCIRILKRELQHAQRAKEALSLTEISLLGLRPYSLSQCDQNHRKGILSKPCFLTRRVSPCPALEQGFGNAI